MNATKNILMKKMGTGIARLMPLCMVLVLLSACTKDINLKLSSTASHIVIEGNIYNQPGPYYVRLSQSQSYYQSNVFPVVTGAQVIISDNAGNTDTLTEMVPGTYKTGRNITGTVGRTYNLTVTAAGQTYKSSSTMPAPVPLDTAIILPPVFGNTTDNIICAIQDPAITVNYYLLYAKQNDSLSTAVTLNDQYNNGGIQQVRIQTPENIKSGDSLTVYMQSIDEGVYNYFNSLNQSTTNSSTVSPANPISNISNGALGYFCAGTLTTKFFVAP